MTIPRCCAAVAMLWIFDGSVAEAQCSYTVTTTTFSAPSTSTNLSTSVVTGTLCSWTATTTASWITVTNPTGTTSGMGTLTFLVAANPGAPRSATLTVANQTVTVNQGANSCTATVTPTNYSFDVPGGTRTLSVTSGTQCTWSATTTDTWITVTNPGSGVGIGSVSFSVTANQGAARVGTLTVAGKPVTINQAGTSDGTGVLPPSNLRVVR